MNSAEYPENMNSIFCHDSQKIEEELIKATSKGYANNSKIVIANNSYVEHKYLRKIILTHTIQEAKKCYINVKFGGHFLFYVVYLL